MRPAVDYATRPYPGEIPESAYCLDLGVVEPLHDTSGEWCLSNGSPLFTWLAQRRGARAALVTYGSNACPGRLAEKFGKKVDGVVCLPAVLHGAARVWSRQISSRGTRPMTLAGAPAGRENVHVLVVPEGYVRALDLTEGRGGPYYMLARLRDCSVVLSGPVGGSWAAPLAYVGHADRGPQVLKGRPVAVSLGMQGLLDAAPPRSADAWLPALEPVPLGVSVVEASAADVDSLLGPTSGEVPGSPDVKVSPGAGS